MCRLVVSVHRKKSGLCLKLTWIGKETRIIMDKVLPSIYLQMLYNDKQLEFPKEVK